MLLRHGRHIASDADDALVAHSEELVERVVEMLVERMAFIAHIVDFHGPRTDGIEDLLHLGHTLSGRGGNEEVVRDLRSRGVGDDERVVLALQGDARMHSAFAHVEEAALVELRRLLRGEEAAVFGCHARLHHARQRRFREYEQRLFLLCHWFPPVILQLSYCTPEERRYRLVMLK